jgi:nucleoside-diphosphate-sugar epimerase
MSESVAIVGMGVLGTSLAKQLLESTDYNLMGITKTTSRHEDLRNELCSDDNERLSLMTMEEAAGTEERYQHVVFCAPPSGFDDYPSAVASAANLRSNDDGSFIFTSSGGVYPDSFDGEIVNESTPLDDSSPRKARGIGAEKSCLENGGCVLRLSGLYTLERGAHNYWLERGDGVVKGREDGIINLLHYDDAASSVVAALRVGSKVNSGKVFLISDGHYTTRRGICESALKSARYKGCNMPKFEGAEGEKRGKIYDGSWSEETLDWKAKYTSFDEFMESMA